MFVWRTRETSDVSILESISIELTIEVMMNELVEDNNECDTLI